MSTEIPFTANHTQQPFKLLELPPELLTLLESDVPPTLLLTSSPQPPHHAHLLVSPSPSTTTSPSPKKTYLLRQKNTSNPLMLLSPSTTSPSSSSSPQPSITRIGSISDTIELIIKEEEIIDGEGKKKEPEVVKKINTGKVNKWHEKFAKSRGNGSGNGTNMKG
ncbi:hypothetical protein BCIN_12g05890 [Botrytis cinerea B05.10]|uniref:Uncharacterized protein n=1 Tax=Botryotinia fuckeliana (strain B05.10) TaxID=332648 RepID=A0A384JZV8_BOTFB|nr:hypothetical protein BCIN_12g05890 [Botrytis cinerea B05.10]ATZ56052.1 hypothetical protein BCIN_12g05890 [Botrytis cinerea B05.10]